MHSSWNRQGKHCSYWKVKKDISLQRCQYYLLLSGALFSSSPLNCKNGARKLGGNAQTKPTGELDGINEYDAIICEELLLVCRLEGCDIANLHRQNEGTVVDHGRIVKLVIVIR